MVRETSSHDNNPPQENPSGHPTRCGCWHGETCECGKRVSSGGIFNQLLGENQGSQLNADVGLLSNFWSERVNGNLFSFLTFSSSFQRSHQALRTTSQVSNKEHSGHNSSPELIAPRSANLLSASTIRSITSCIANAPNLNLSHAMNQIGKAFPGSQNESDSGPCTTLVFGSTPLRQFSLFRSVFGPPYNLLRSLWLPSASGDSTSQSSQASASSDDNGFQNEAEIDLWRQLLMESTLYIYRPADSLLEGSTSFFVVTGNNVGVGFRLVTEEQNAEVLNQSLLYFSIEMRNRYGALWFNVDNMSYEELLALEDHIGYVNTGLSEEAAAASLKCSSYFLLAEENSQKEFCSICQEDFVEEDEVGTLDCEHSFHIACIKQWLGYKNICPICKSPGLYTTRPSFSQIQSM